MRGDAMVGRIRIVAGTFSAALVLALALAPAARADKPVCKDGSFTGPVNAPISLTSLTCTNLTGIPAITVKTPPQHGQLSSGMPYTYTPATGYHGRDTFTY